MAAACRVGATRLAGAQVWSAPALLAVFLMFARPAQAIYPGEPLPPTTVVQVDGVSFEFISVAPGEFWMGSEAGEATERPRHLVRLAKGFELARTEVTVGQFRAFVAAAGYVTDAEREGWAWSTTGQDWVQQPGSSWRNPGFPQTEADPVVCVSWNDAWAFCQWLSQRSGGPCRLPTEAEWEYACRAGTLGEYAGAPEEMGWDLGWHLFDSQGRTQPVGLKAPNAWGLHDLHGNVWEWCADTWHPDYAGAPADGSAWVPGDHPARVVRGGAWNRPPEVMRSASRYAAPATDSRSINIGFRVARSVSASPPSAVSSQDAARGLRLARAPHRWTNSLGMVFAPVRGTRLWLCLWETRVQDFAAFVSASGYDAEESAPATAGSGQPRRTWRDPGFAQGPTHPVVCVNWHDARSFCQWLTETERSKAQLAAPWRYRLPSDAEWSAAAGNDRYPWGESMPPVRGAGNYAGAEARAADSAAWFKTLRDYDDGQPRTAPVGSYRPNAQGFFDLGGNVWEWCEDWYRRNLLPPAWERVAPFHNLDGGGQRFKVLRGASWLDSHPVILRAQLRFFEFPDQRSDHIGCRVALALD